MPSLSTIEPDEPAASAAPLRRHLLTRLAIGLPLLAVAALGFTLTSLHGRESRDFERRATRAPGTVTDLMKEEASFIPHIEVSFQAGARVIVTRAAVADRGAYHLGQVVTVLYDPSEPSHIVLDTDRYNAETPFLFWAAVAVGGLLPIVFGWWWVRRIRRLAERPGTAFAVRATVADLRPRRWNRRRRWVVLHALDAHLPPPAETGGGPSANGPLPVHPIGSYPLMTGVVVDRGVGLPTEAKGSLRPGGLVVARVGDEIAWPRRRLRG